MPELKFCTAVNCIDGRVQLPVIRYLQKRFGISYVDMVTETGPVRAMSDGVDSEARRSIERRVRMSIDMHASSVVSVVAHEGCAGNPVGPDRQMEQLGESVRWLSERFPDVSMVGLWVTAQGEVTETGGAEAQGRGSDPVVGGDFQGGDR